MNLRSSTGVVRLKVAGPGRPAAAVHSNAPNMTLVRTVIHGCLGAALAAGALLASPLARAADTPPPAPGPVARVGERTIDAADIRAAAEALANDPMHRKSPRRWRRMLVDRCIDRELLAQEAERRGYAADPVVERRIRDRDFELCLGELYRRVLIPGIKPTQRDLDSLRATGLYRDLDLDYILMPPPQREEAIHVAQRLREGARFDSTARQWSQHPSRANGGHFGWVLARDLDHRSYPLLRKAKPGDVLGPYSGRFGCEIYRIRAFKELSPDSLYRLVRDERTRGLLHNYQEKLLAQYHFAVDSSQANAVLFLTATEPVNRILASLGPDGTRPRTPGHPGLGVIARVDGDSITFRDLAESDRRTWGKGQRMHLRDIGHVEVRCEGQFMPELVLRDARRRGIVRDPIVARELRLIGEEETTRAMVRHESGGPVDSVDAMAYFRAHPDRYRRAAAVRARAFCFDPDSDAVADAALRSWLVPGVADTIAAAHGFRTEARATATTLWPRRFGEITVLATDSDPVAAALRDLHPGRLTPAIPSVQGLVVAEALEREAPRPMTFEEARDAARRDAAAARSARWVAQLLPKLRAATKPEIFASRLGRVRVDAPAPKKGTR